MADTSDITIENSVPSDKTPLVGDNVVREATNSEPIEFDNSTSEKVVDEKIGSLKVGVFSNDSNTKDVIEIADPYSTTNDGELPAVQLILEGLSAKDKAINKELNEELATEVKTKPPHELTVRTAPETERPEFKEVKERRSETVEGEGGSKITYDDHGRINRIKYGNEDRIREVEYFGDSNEIKSFSTILNGVSQTQSRETPQTDDWQSDSRRIRNFKGRAMMTEEGTFSLQFANGDGTWQTRWANNQTTDDTINSDGTRTTFDKSGNILRFKNAENYSAKAENNGNGKQVKITLTDAEGVRSSWSKNEDGTWSSETSAEKRLTMELLNSGDIRYKTEDGIEKRVKPNGNLEIENKDGSISEITQDGKLARVTQRDGNYRTFEYENDKLVLASDTIGNKKRTAFQRFVEDGRSKITISKEGDISYIKPDGNSVTRNANGTNIERNSENNVVRVAMRDGRLREFEYDQTGKVLTEITDTKQSNNGELSRQTLIKQNDRGLFVGTSHQGKEIARKNIEVNDDGTYNFNNKNDSADSRLRIAQVGGIESALSAWDVSFSTDDQDRISTVDGQDKVRKYEYFSDSKEVSKFTSVDKRSGEESVWVRDNADSNRWYKLNEDGTRPYNAWRGKVKVASNGVHLYQASDYYGRYGKTWKGTFPDGTKVSATETKNGSLLFKDERSKEAKGTLLNDGSSIIVGQKDGKLAMTVFNAEREESTTWTKEASTNSWHSDNSTNTGDRKNLRFDDNGTLIFEDSKGRTSREALDGTLVVEQKGDGTLTYNSDGRLVKINHHGTERDIHWNNGRVDQITDTNSKKETRTIFQHNGEGEARTQFNLDDNGNFSYKLADGGSITLRSNGLKLEHDAEGSLMRAEKQNGSTREFNYQGSGADKHLTEITDTRRRRDGTDRVTKWSREVVDGEPKNHWTSQTQKGNERQPRKDIRLIDDGAFEYKLTSDKATDKPRVARLGVGDGLYMSESVEDGHYNLLETMEAYVERPRVERMEKMMKRFEQRMADQYELMTMGGVPADQARQQLDDAMTKTYDHMVRLMTPPDQKGQFHSQRERIFLAENFMYHAADPTTIEQGNTGTCWWESSYAVAMERNTNHLAKFVTDVALTGQYKSVAGKPDRYGRITEAMHKIFSPRYGEVDIRNSRHGFEIGNGWSIETADNDSTRSPVSRIIDNYGPAVLGWRSQGRPNSGGHGEAWRILYMMSGRKVVQHGSSRLGRSERIKLLRDGGYTASGGGHMWGYCMRKVGDEWHVIRNDQYQNRDRVISRIRNLQEWIDNGTRDSVRKTWRPYSPNNPDDQPYIIDREDDYRPDRPNRPFRPWIRRPRRPIIRRFFR